MNAMTREQFIKLKHEVNRSVMNSLIGCATKKMRAVTAILENRNLIINMFFDNDLTEEEEAEMQNANTEVISDLHYDFDLIDLTLITVDSAITLLDRKGNLGWFYLRKEY